MLFGAKEAGCLREVAAQHIDHLIHRFQCTCKHIHLQGQEQPNDSMYMIQINIMHQKCMQIELLSIRGIMQKRSIL